MFCLTVRMDFNFSWILRFFVLQRSSLPLLAVNFSKKSYVGTLIKIFCQQCVSLIFWSYPLMFHNKRSICTIIITFSTVVALGHWTSKRLMPFIAIYLCSLIMLSLPSNRLHILSLIWSIALGGIFLYLWWVLIIHHDCVLFTDLFHCL